MSAIPADLRVQSPWRLALPALGALVLAILWLYRDTAVAMVGIWSRSDTFAHAFLVPPIALWLVWRQRAHLATLTPRPQPWMLLPLLAVALFWLASDLVVVNAGTQFALVAMLVLAVPAVLGFEVARAIMFPLGFMFFCVPIGEFMLPVMIAATADFTVAALQFSGIPVYREGNQFIIPTGSWSVVEACSGVRYLIASFMVGTLFAYLNYRSTRRRLIFVAVSLLVPVLANWLRAYMIVMLGHLSGNTIAVGADHLLYGWVFFGIVIMLMFFIGARWSEPEAPPAAAGAPALGGWGVNAAGAPSAAALATLVAAAALVVGLPGAVGHRIEQTETGIAAARFELPPRLAGAWTSEGANIADWKPHLEGEPVESFRAYTDGRRQVGVHVGYFRGQSLERKLVSSANVLVPSMDKRWNHVASGVQDVPLAGQSLRVKTGSILALERPGVVGRSHLAVWHAYWVDGHWIAGDAAAKVQGALARLRGHGDEGAVVYLYVDDESAASATATLQDFTQANLAALGDLLRQTRDAR